MDLVTRTTINNLITSLKEKFNDWFYRKSEVDQKIEEALAEAKHYTDLEIENYHSNAFAISFVEDGKWTLKFYVDYHVPYGGGTYDGHQVEEVYTFSKDDEYGDDSEVPWSPFRYVSNPYTIAFDESFAAMKFVSTAYWFQDFSVMFFEGLENINMSEVESTIYMFADCAYVDNLTDGMNKWDTSSLISTEYMFRNCTQLSGVDLSGWDTSKLNYTSYMFENCTHLTEVDLSGWDTSNVQQFEMMFFGCSNLETVWVSEGQFDISNADPTFSEDVFSGCTSIVGGNGTTYDSSKKDIDMAHIDTEDNPGYFTETEYMSIAIYSDTDNSLTFYGVRPIATNGIWEGIYNGKNATDVYTNFDTEVYTSQSSVPWYNNRNNVKTVAFDPSFTNVKCQAMACWFFNYSSVTTWSGFEYIDTSAVTSIDNMFSDCTGLTDISSLSSWDTSSIVNMQGVFQRCTGLTNISALSKWDTSSAANMCGIFNGCSSLTNISVLSSWDTSSVTNVANLFMSCPELTDISAISDWDMSMVTDMKFMLYNCSKLTIIDISKWNTSLVTDMQNMFNGCSELTTIYSDDDVFVVPTNYTGDMFRYCYKLVGGNGTVYDSNSLNGSMAHVDVDGNPGYFTAKE